jgi:AcrR family transcriptional regulator
MCSSVAKLTAVSERETLGALKRRQARADLIDAALRLFEERGFEQTTVADVAAAAMQSPRTFFRYFGSKDDVLFDDIGDHLDLLRSQISANLDAGQEPWPAVVDAIQSLTLTHLGPSNARRRMQLWLKEPALRIRYIEQATRWEVAIAETVAQHSGTASQSDIYAQAVAVAAISGFRVAADVASSGDTDFLTRLSSILELLGKGLARDPHTP